jgi:hypothetical protein
MTLEGWSYLPLPNFIYALLRVEVSYVLDFHSTNQMREGGR